MKRPCFFSLIFSAISLVALCSCGKTLKSDIPFDSVCVKRQVALTNDKNSPLCEVNISLLYANKPGDKVAREINNTIIADVFNYEHLTMKQAVDSFTNKYISDYKENLTDMYKADRSNRQVISWYQYKYTLKSYLKEARNGVLCYAYDMDSYEGGAHSTTLSSMVNFDIKTGKQITLKDIFAPGYESPLNDLLLNALQKKKGVKDIEGLHNMGYLLSTDIYAPENFILEDNGITFIYNPYEIAPYALGATDITISNSDLKKILK